MGIVNTITHDKFPEQGNLVGQSVRVCFHYDTTNILKGQCVRNDMEEPYQTLFRLDNGRYVLADECQYTMDKP